MKKILILTLILSIALCGCGQAREIEELNQTISSLRMDVSNQNTKMAEKEKQLARKEEESKSKDSELIELQSQNKLLQEKLEYCTYVSGAPKTKGSPVDVSEFVEPLLIKMKSKIIGKVSNEVSNGTVITFDITTEKGGLYHSILMMTDDKNDVLAITIYLNSEFCYTWYNESLWIVDGGQWMLDGLTD